MTTFGMYNSGAGGAETPSTPGNGNGPSNGNGNHGDGGNAPNTIAELLGALKDQATSTDAHLATSSAETQYLTKSKADLQKQIADLTKELDALASKQDATQTAIDEAGDVVEKYEQLLQYQIPQEFRNRIEDFIKKTDSSIKTAGEAARDAVRDLDSAETALVTATQEKANKDRGLKAAQDDLNGLVGEIQEATSQVNSLAKDVKAKFGASQQEYAYWLLQDLKAAIANLNHLLDPGTEQRRVAAVLSAATDAATASQTLIDKTIARDQAKQERDRTDTEWQDKKKRRNAAIKKWIDDFVSNPPNPDPAPETAVAAGGGRLATGSL
jgi:chromosome segregation ATPase